MEHTKIFTVSITHAGAGRIKESDIKQAINHGLEKYRTGTIKVMEMTEMSPVEISKSDGKEMVNGYLCIPAPELGRLIEFIHSRPTSGSTTGTSNRKEKRTGSC